MSEYLSKKAAQQRINLAVYAHEAKSRSASAVSASPLHDGASLQDGGKYEGVPKRNVLPKGASVPRPAPGA